MFGGAGDDIYVVDNAGDIVVENANGGNDTVRTSLSSYDLTANVEVLTYTGLGNFIGTGNALNNIITGGIGNDQLFGMDGNDQLIGGLGNDYLEGGIGTDNLQGDAGNDTLAGGAGVDSLNGGTGNDILIGDAGNDILTGGSGSDNFVFGVGFGRDTITDFDSNPTGGQDFIDLQTRGITAATFASSVSITGNNNTTTLTLSGGDVITLTGTAANSVTINDFHLLS
ncbi:Hemolysin, chromosomal [compost metagenome]